MILLVGYGGGNLLAEILKSASQEICLGESASRNTKLCQSVNMPADSPNLPVRKSASEESASQEIYQQIHQICQSGNCLGGICLQKYPNLPVSKSAGGNLPAEIPKSASRFTKSASQEICLGESASRYNLICQSVNLLWGLCWKKYPYLPVLSTFFS